MLAHLVECLPLAPVLRIPFGLGGYGVELRIARRHVRPTNASAEPDLDVVPELQPLQRVEPSSAQSFDTAMESAEHHASTSAAEGGGVGSSLPPAAMRAERLVEATEAAALLEGAGGDLQLMCEGGSQVQAHSQVLALASPYFREHAAAPASLQVDGSTDVWEHILCRLYPVFPKPRIDVEVAAAVLPVAAKYNLLPVVAELNAQLLRVFPASLSEDPRSPCYVIRWLRLADELQLAGLRKMCLAKVQEFVVTRHAAQALLQSIEGEGEGEAEAEAEAEAEGEEEGEGAQEGVEGEGRIGGRGEGGEVRGWQRVAQAVTAAGAEGQEAAGEARKGVAGPRSHRVPVVGGAGGSAVAAEQWRLRDSVRRLSRPLVEDLVAAVAVVVGREQAVPVQAVPVH